MPVPCLSACYIIIIIIILKKFSMQTLRNNIALICTIYVMICQWQWVLI